MSRLLEEQRRTGVVVLDLTESNPTRVGLAMPRELLAPLSEPAALRYDPVSEGLALTREAVSVDYARRGLLVPADRIVLTASSSEAYGFLFKLLCDPGDCVLVPRPSYPLFDFLARLESVELVSYPLTYDGEWHIDAAGLRAALEAHPRARAICVVHPNNPTGSFVKREEAALILGLAAERDLAVISDEVFADYAFADDAARFPSFAADGPALAFALGGLSKSCGLPQMKLGWIAVAGPSTQRREALARLEIVADSFLSVSTPIQRAAASWLARRTELTRPIADRITLNLAELWAQLASAPPATLLTVEGGWYALLQVPNTMTEEERVMGLLDQHHVLVHPGYFFDFPSEAFLVLSLLPAADVFREGASRLLRTLQ